MQRIINDPSYVVEDMLKGFTEAHDNILEISELNPRVVVSKTVGPLPRVGIVTGGGSGHKPAFIGYIGENLIDAVAVGEIFSSPTAKTFYDAFREANQGKGIACLYGNYAGDNMNVKIAKELAEDDDIIIKTVVANDDVASAPKTERNKRRGVAGEILMWKVAGAKAAMGADLNEVIATAQYAIDNTRSVGIGLTSCTIPAVGHPNFHIEDNTMEVGIGHHGESGISVEPLKSAKDMAREAMDIIIPDLPFVSGDEVAVLVSGLGATPVMELYIFYHEVADILKASGINIRFKFVGNYFTSLDMMGVTVTLMKINEELAELIAYPCKSMAITQ